MANDNKQKPVAQNGNAVEQLAASLFSRNWNMNLAITPKAFALKTIEAANAFYEAVVESNKPS